MKKCTIIYTKDENSYEIPCMDCSLNSIIAQLKSQGAEITQVTIHEKFRTPRKNPSNDELEKRKYYNSKYIKYYREYKQNSISKETFDTIKKCLKDCKANSKTKIEFKSNFEKTIKEF